MLYIHTHIYIYTYIQLPIALRSIVLHFIYYMDLYGIQYNVVYIYIIYVYY